MKIETKSKVVEIRNQDCKDKSRDNQARNQQQLLV